MRRLPAAALLGAVLLIAAGPARAFEGCLGAPVRACLDAVKPFLSAVDYRMANQSVDKFLAGDIAGRRKSSGHVVISYHSRYSDPSMPAQIVKLDFAPTLAISQVEVTLREGALLAESEAEYQATHMYEATVFALGSRENCREMASAREFYLFFHLKLRPKLKKQASVKRADGFKPASEYEAQTGWINLCGSQLNFVEYAAEWGSVQATMDRKFAAAFASLLFR